MASIDDCRISWLKPFGKPKGRLRVQHMTSGYEVAREDVGLRDEWGLDELLSQIDALLSADPLAPRYRRP